MCIATGRNRRRINQPHLDLKLVLSENVVSNQVNHHLKRNRCHRSEIKNRRQVAVETATETTATKSTKIDPFLRVERYVVPTTTTAQDSMRSLPVGQSCVQNQHETTNDACEIEEARQSNIIIQQPIECDPVKADVSLYPTKYSSKDSYNASSLWYSILILNLLLNISLFLCNNNSVFLVSISSSVEIVAFCDFIQKFVINNGTIISMIFLLAMLVVRAVLSYLSLVYIETNFDIEEDVDVDEEVGRTIAIHQQQEQEQEQEQRPVSTEEMYKSNSFSFYGRYAHIREKLDYSHHNNYTYERQIFQDSLITNLLSVGSTPNNRVDGNKPIAPWILFTAGAMGVGKSYTMKKLVASGRFPALEFVKVDPDEIRRLLPEFEMYLHHCNGRCAELAGKLTQKEAGYISEILTKAALEREMNVMVDGSLRDAKWYKSYFYNLRKQFPIHRLAIIHVSAPREAIFQRAADRALLTGRIVPQTLLNTVIEQIPKSMQILAPLVDYYVELYNAPNTNDIELITPNETWQSFQSRWTQ